MLNNYDDWKCTPPGYYEEVELVGNDELEELHKELAQARRVIADQRVQLAQLRARVVTPVYEEDVQLEDLV